MRENERKKFLEDAKEIEKRCLYTREEEQVAIFNEYIDLLDLWSTRDKDNDKPLVLKCVALQRFHKRPIEEVIEIAKLALSRRETYDALSYFARAVSAHCSEEQELVELDNCEEDLESKDLRNIVRLYRAIAHYKVQNWDAFVDEMDAFWRGKNPNFNPYVITPASTVRLRKNSSLFLKDCGLADVLPKRLMEKKGSRHETKKLVISVSADLIYLKKYGEFFFESVMLSCSDVMVHLGVNGSGREAQKFLSGLSFWDELKNRIYISEWNFESNENLGPISASMRLWHVHELLSKFRSPVVVLDLDTVITREVSEILEVVPPRTDVVVREIKSHFPWERFTAGFLFVLPTRKGINFAKNIKKHLEEYIVDYKAQWWVDQNAIESAWRASLEEGSNTLFFNAVSIRDNFMVQPTGLESVKITALSDSLKSLKG